MSNESRERVPPDPEWPAAVAATLPVCALPAVLLGAAVAIARIDWLFALALGLMGAFAFVQAWARIYGLASARRAWQGSGPSIVQMIRGDEVHLILLGPVDRRLLRALGGRDTFFVPGYWKFKVSDERELARVAGKLRDLGAVFPDDDRGGWGPASRFDDLRKRGLVDGEYIAVYYSRGVIYETR